MADQFQVDLLKEDVVAFHQWRMENGVKIDLSGADLSEEDLSGANLISANLSGANLAGTDLGGAYLSSANLSNAILYLADLWKADLWNANLSDADLREANLSGADLREANLSGADLREANLSGVNLSEANLSNADLTGCRVYAISAWDVILKDTIQSSLIITREPSPNLRHPSSSIIKPLEEPTITVDNLEVAQFIYLLLNNQKIRDVIDTITSKVVLVLGRFTKERKQVLDVLREELHKRNYLPVLFDFEKPASRDLTETVSTLAHLARFIIVDLTDPSSAPHEVATVIPQTVVPVLPLLTLQPLIVDGKAVERREYAMFEDLRRRYHWVLPTFRYQDIPDLLASLQVQVIEPAEQKAKELAQR